MESKYDLKIFDTYEDFRVGLDEIVSLGEEDFEVYSPIPVELPEKYKSKRKNRVSLLTLIGGIFGFIAALYFQYWSGLNYKINVGGKPFFNWVYSVPTIFEITILFAVVFAIFGFLASKSLKPPKELDPEKFAIVVKL